MKRSTTGLLLVAVTALFAAAPADAHGRVLAPRVVFSGPYPDSPVDQIDGYKALPPPSGQSYSGTPDTNTRAFTQAMALAQASYPTLRAFVLDHQGPRVRACGDTTVEDVARQPLPAAVEFGFRANEGFVPDHQGPCEVWCGNDTRVFHDNNCAKTFRDGPAKLPYDRTKCDASGARVLTFYWLALHLPKWQLYVNCAVIATSGSSGGAGSANAAAATPTPTKVTTPTTTKPTAVTPRTTKPTTTTPTATTTPAAPENWVSDSDLSKTPAPTPIATKTPKCGVRASSN